MEINDWDDDFAPDFSEIEIGRMSDEEYDLANLRHELFLARERDELALAEHELEEELSRLFSMTSVTEAGRIQPSATGRLR